MAILDTGTIVAVVTPEGKGGLAVVRMSGRDAIAVARRLVPGGTLAEPVESHRARLAVVYWPDRDAAALDQALVLPLLSPASYTGEDTVEFFCHGGLMPARQVAAACRQAGARAATAGEFTRRAFLNGRLSLTQAEAVADLIAAEHAVPARAALTQLRGGLKREIAAVEEPLLALLAELEGSLEFADEEDGPATGHDLDTILAAAIERIETLLDLAPAGRRLREGVQVVLTGPVNAGKSSLFNALLAEDRALVDPEAGTTRDVVTAPLELDGLLFVLHDTAGLREQATGVEAKGIARTTAALAGADIVLALTPADTDPVDGGSSPPPSGATVLQVVTKADLAPATSAGLVTSSRTGRGVAELRAALLRTARADGIAVAAAQGVMLSQRHQDRLRSCREALVAVREAVDAGEDVVATLLATALQDLGAVSGRVFNERLLGDIFARFCVGK